MARHPLAIRWVHDPMRSYSIDTYAIYPSISDRDVALSRRRRRPRKHLTRIAARIQPHLATPWKKNAHHA